MTRCGVCPDRSQLIRFVHGHLPEPEITNIERHLEECIHCGDTLEALRLSEPDILASLESDSGAKEETERHLVTELVDQISEWRLSSSLSEPVGESERLEERNADISKLEGWLRRELCPTDDSSGLGKLGPFVIRRILGIGGMGVVCEADDPGLNRKVAVKILKPDLAANANARKRFMREARAAAAIEHANVIAIHHVGEDRDIPYLAMALLPGVTLQEHVASSGPLSYPMAVSIARQIAAGLAAAHHRGLIHRDIKPTNIFLTRPDNQQIQPQDEPLVKLLDFGLARAADEDAAATDTGTLAGTPSYMSPEQAQAHQVDHRSDLFSLGCVMYWMVTGRSPFGGANKTASLLAVVQHHPLAPNVINPAVPEAFSAVVMKLLAKDPDQRYRSAGEVMDALSFANVDGRGSASRIPPAKWLGVAGLAAGVIALATVVYVMTGRGVLVLEINESDVKVALDGSRVAITSPRDQIEIGVGDHELQVTKDGFTSFSKRFHVRRGEKVEFAARLEPLPPAVNNNRPHLNATTDLSIEVPATRQWTATGVKVFENMELQIFASGSVDGAPESDTREYYQDVPPAGRQERIEHFPQPTLPGLCLMGRIGTGPTFYVGEEQHFIVKPTDAHGELYLGINDDVVEDNFGVWKVKIKTLQGSSK